MWIRTKEDYFLNTDHMLYIVYNNEDDTTDCKLGKFDFFEICEGDRVQEIVQNIISGTKLMEVQ